MSAVEQMISPGAARPDVVAAGRRRGLRGFDPLTATGVAILVTLLVASFVGPWLSPWGSTTQDLLHPLASPGSAHWLGTDQLGRDVLTRVLYAGRIDVFIGVLATVVSAAIGILVGLIAGSAGGVLDAVISRVMDVFLAFPLYLLLITVVFLFGAGVSSIIGAFAIVSWVAYARLTRAQVLVLKDADFVTAARLAGVGRLRVLLWHMVPNVVAQCVVYATSDVVFNILAIVTLGFLGLGVPAPTPEWGTMIADGAPYLTSRWWLIVAPGVGVVLVGLALTLVADGLTRRWRSA